MLCHPSNRHCSQTREILSYGPGCMLAILPPDHVTPCPPPPFPTSSSEFGLHLLVALLHHYLMNMLLHRRPPQMCAQDS